MGLILLPLVACDSAANQRRRLGSPYPLDRAQAAVRLAERGDSAAVHKLVDLLEDSDRAVRMYGILALERLCGRTFGYKYYASAAKRAPAVRRWRQALRTGELVVRPPPLKPDEGRGKEQVSSGAAAGSRHARTVHE